VDEIRLFSKAGDDAPPLVEHRRQPSNVEMIESCLNRLIFFFETFFETVAPSIPQPREGAVPCCNFCQCCHVPAPFSLSEKLAAS
jgi:hypothetical protein